MNKKLCKIGILIFWMVFAFSSCAETSSNEKYFICDVIEGDIRKKVDINKPYDGSLNYFDRVFSYNKAKDGSYTAQFSNEGSALGIKFQKGILSNAYLVKAREQQGFYREIFDVYYIDVNTNVLTHAYVYYLDPADYEKHFNNPQFVPYNKPYLFGLVNKAPPKNYVKIGWDKTRWLCYPSSRRKGLWTAWKLLFQRLLSP